MLDHKLISLSGKHGKGKFAIVDADQHEDLIQWAWHTDWNGYVRRGFRCQGKPRIELMHRRIINAPAGLQVDHVNGETLDNRSVNLRLCTNQQNSRNRHVVRGVSKFKGVSWDARRGKWMATIKLNKKAIYLGLFVNECLAASS